MEVIEDSSLEFCRICARLSSQTQNLFEISHNGIVLAEMLKFCLKRQISKADGLPKTICASCKANLITTYEFHSLCEFSEQYFLKGITTKGTHDPSTQKELTSKDQNIEVNSTEVKNEVEFNLSATNVDEEADFSSKAGPTLASELVCVEEDFDENDLTAEESPESLRPRLRNQNVLKRQIGRSRRIRNKFEEKEFECFDCKKNFEILRELRTHMLEHDNDEKPFECATCKMRFVHLNSWFRHRARHKKNIHDCEYCDETFNTLTALKHHIQDLHKDRLNAYKCDQCTEEFALHFLLVWHKEWHKKAKQFVCSTCDAVFFNERKLKAHIRDNHASEYH